MCPDQRHQRHDQRFNHMTLTEKSPAISFYTLGCRLNQSETAVIQNQFNDQGYRIVDFNEPADITVINTCTVTENGDADTRHLINKIRRLNPAAQIALIGCQAQVQKERLADLPNVKWIVGNARKFALTQIIEEFQNPLTAQIITPTIPKDSFSIPFAGIDPHHTRANLKIQDGCDFFCSFCEIPYARGRARSRQFSDLLNEARILTRSGYKEIILTGINLGTYQDEDQFLLDVISALEELEGLERIRLSSIEPTTIPGELIAKMSQGLKLCRYLHIPIQSANDFILNRMKRRYTFAEFKDFVLKAYQAVPGICIGTDVIVGFPGETEEYFQETYDRLRELPVHYFHVFSYSRRQMAKSRDLGDSVVPEIIRQRSERMRNLSLRKKQLFYQTLLGTTTKILVEQKKKGCWNGVTDNYVRVQLRSEQTLTNQLVTVRINEVRGLDVFGEMI